MVIWLIYGIRVIRGCGLKIWKIFIHEKIVSFVIFKLLLNRFCLRDLLAGKDYPLNTKFFFLTRLHTISRGTKKLLVLNNGNAFWFKDLLSMQYISLRAWMKIMIQNVDLPEKDHRASHGDIETGGVSMYN